MALGYAKAPESKGVKPRIAAIIQGEILHQNLLTVEPPWKTRVADAASGKSTPSGQNSRFSQVQADMQVTPYRVAFGSDAHRRLQLGRFLRIWGEASAHRVLGDGPGQQEFPQVVGPTRFGTDARELEAAERLAIDQGTGDRPVDIEVADPEL